MATRTEPVYGERVAIPWGAGEVIAHVHEVYGRPSRRYVVVLLAPEMSGYVVDEETTLAWPLEEVRWGRELLDDA